MITYKTSASSCFENVETAITNFLRRDPSFRFKNPNNSYFSYSGVIQKDKNWSALWGLYQPREDICHVFLLNRDENNTFPLDFQMGPNTKEHLGLIDEIALELEREVEDLGEITIYK